MDMLLIILLALMTVAIPALAETAAAGHIGVGSTTTTSAARDVRGLDVAGESDRRLDGARLPSKRMLD
jgi:hypothetical protein